jgi:hypothetical protein
MAIQNKNNVSFLSESEQKIFDSEFFPRKLDSLEEVVELNDFLNVESQRKYGTYI